MEQGHTTGLVPASMLGKGSDSRLCSPLEFLKTFSQALATKVVTHCVQDLLVTPERCPEAQTTHEQTDHQGCCSPQAGCHFQICTENTYRNTSRLRMLWELNRNKCKRLMEVDKKGPLPPGVQRVHSTSSSKAESRMPIPIDFRLRCHQS